MATSGKNLSAYKDLDLKNPETLKIGIAVSEWNPQITEALHKGALQVFSDNGILKENIYNLILPGSFELVYGCKHLITKHNLDAVIAIGSVIQGETKHFDFVCNAVALGIKDLIIKYDTPIVFCVLTDNTLQQAIDRSGGKHGNKGIECAVAALKMVNLREN